jgi:hypothetical protein
MTSDPLRLSEDPAAASALRSDLVHATQVKLEGLDLAAGLAALGSATATVTSSTTVVASTSLLAKLGVGVGVTAVGVVALWLGLRSPIPSPDEDERVAAPAVSETEQARHEPGLGARPAAPAMAAPPERDSAAIQADPGQGGAEASPAPEPATAVPRSNAAADPQPALVKSRREARPVKAVDRPDPADPADPAEGVLQETKLVAKARSNLAHDPARALALAEQAERDFPQGQLVEERRALAIRALVALGRLDEAERRAGPFLAEHGRGAHAAAVRRALDGQVEEP